MLLLWLLLSKSLILKLKLSLGKQACFNMFNDILTEWNKLDYQEMTAPVWTFKFLCVIVIAAMPTALNSGAE